MSRVEFRAFAVVLRRLTPIAASVFFLVSSVRVANAQELFWRVDGTGSETIGAELATLTDIDGDGVREVIAGADFDNLVRVFSGASGAPLLEWIHTPPNKYFGAALSDAGDVNGDGVADVIVGAPGVGLKGDSGDAYVYSGLDGSNLLQFSGTNTGDSYGRAVCGLGDIDGDGFGDVAIGAPTDHQVLFVGDRVEVFSGKTGQLLYVVPPVKSGDSIGVAIALLDDLDGDGLRDFATGAYIGQYVQVVSSKSGNVLLTIQSPGGLDWFGRSLAAIGDLDSDGFGDLLVGSPLRVQSGRPHCSGAAEVFSPVTGALLQQHLPSGGSEIYYFGWRVASAGDSNGDGAPDMLVGYDLGSSPGYSHLYSGRSGLLLYRFDALGSIVGGIAGGADFDRDGLDDVAIGEMTSGPGFVEVRRGNDLYLNIEPPQRLVGDTLEFTLGEGVPGNLALVALTGVNGVPTFLPLTVAPLDSNGELLLQGTIPKSAQYDTFDFLGMAIAASGKLSLSATETILIQ